MNFNWLNYLTLAKILASATEHPELEEARLRASISRAYYAAFSLAKKKITLKSALRTGQDSHKIYIDVFYENDDLSIRGIGVNLDRMKVARKNADYDDQIQNIKSLTEDTLERAADVISGLGTLPSEGLIQSED